MKTVIPSIYLLLFFVALITGCGGSSSPEGSVKAFLDEVNKGNTESAKEYFSGEYKGGYDNHDKNKLERIFPPGSIRAVTFANVNAVGETATLNVTIERSTGVPYSTTLKMVRKDGEWKIQYDGWHWPFPVK